MRKVKPKKYLGQHFLNNESIASKIADIALESGLSKWVEIGPGMGVLTAYLVCDKLQVKVVEIDDRSVAYLEEEYPKLNIIGDDFLKLDLAQLFKQEFGIIGNFPYNISSQIVFKVLDNVQQIPSWGGMFQKEVAERICSAPHSKKYGIISVLTQAYYSVELLFEVSPNNFDPPPKVDSAVIKAKRLDTKVDCEKKLLFRVVKLAFGQRRKTLKNTLKSLNLSDEILSQNEQMLKLRAENLSVDDFVQIANWIKG